MNSFGPLYCETAYPFIVAEPINTLTNFIIIGFGIYAFIKIKREVAKFPLDLFVLATLLIATGIGSFFWHAFRTPVALTFDVFPGLLFFMLFTYLWGRKMHGILFGILGLVTLVTITFGSVKFFQAFSLPIPFLLPIFSGTLFLATIFIYLTYRKYGKAVGLHSLFLVLAALSAAVFRTIDLFVCEYIPFGTHFLWHTFLPFAAYLGILLLLKIDRRN